MNKRLLLSLLLLPTAAIYAMEPLDNEIIVYNINPCLNRVEKNALRATSKKLYKLLVYQSLLNENYAHTCAINNQNEMAQWRKKGALHLHEEIYNLFIDDKKYLGTKIWNSHKSGLGAFCLQSAFSHGIIANNKAFISFLLAEAKPLYDSEILITSIAHSKQLGHTDITTTLEWYITQEKAPKHTMPYLHRGGGSGPPPLMPW